MRVDASGLRRPRSGRQRLQVRQDLRPGDQRGAAEGLFDADAPAVPEELLIRSYNSEDTLRITVNEFMSYIATGFVRRFTEGNYTLLKKSLFLKFSSALRVKLSGSS